MANLDRTRCHTLVDGQEYPMRYTGSFPQRLFYSETRSVPIYSYSKPPELSERLHGAYYKEGVLDRPFWEADYNVRSPVGVLHRWSGHYFNLKFPNILESDAAVQLPRYDRYGNPLPRRYGSANVIRGLNGYPRTVLAQAGMSANPPDIWVLEGISLLHGFSHCLQYDLLPVHAFVDCQTLYDEISGPWVNWRNLNDPNMVLIDKLHKLWITLREAKLATLNVVPRERIYLADYATRLAPTDERWYVIPDITQSFTGRFFTWMDVSGRPYIWYPRIAY